MPDRTPETLNDLAARARFASEWLAQRADTHRAEARELRETEPLAARTELGMSIAREDAARILASIADRMEELLGTAPGRHPLDR